jgi:hypothetical protein
MSIESPAGGGSGSADPIRETGMQPRPPLAKMHWLITDSCSRRPRTPNAVTEPVRAGDYVYGTDGRIISRIHADDLSEPALRSVRAVSADDPPFHQLEWSPQRYSPEPAGIIAVDRFRRPLWRRLLAPPRRADHAYLRARHAELLERAGARVHLALESPGTNLVMYVSADGYVRGLVLQAGP